MQQAFVAISAMAEDQDGGKKAVEAYSVFVRLALPPYTIHFKSPNCIKESTMDMLDRRVCKETLRATSQRAEVRCVCSTVLI